MHCFFDYGLFHILSGSLCICLDIRLEKEHDCAIHAGGHDEQLELVDEMQPSDLELVISIRKAHQYAT